MESGAFEILAAEGQRSPQLAMQRLWLTGQVLAVGARLLVQHTFRSAEQGMQEVVYAFMLPRDAALRRFEVRAEGFETHSELKKVEEAAREYEEGIAAGHLATLARSYRDGVVNLSLGNLRGGEEVNVTIEILAGVELHDDSLRFRFPFTLAPGYHPRALMRDSGGTGEIELPASEFGDVLLPGFERTADGLHEIGFDLAVRVPGAIAEVGSPSHAIRVREDGGIKRVALATAADVPDRDLVLDVRIAQPTTQVLAGEGHFAMVVPSDQFGKSPDAPRKVAIVIDRSGSMRGEPMNQARHAVEACLAALGPQDQFALVAFDNETETFRDALAQPTHQNRQAAKSFLDGIQARGGTELARGFSAGARLARDCDVLVITDGQVMGTEEILAEARALNIRIHCLGIGSASQDRFLAQLAQATGGVSRFVTARERVDVAAVDLFASIGRPVALGVHADGATFAIKPPEAVFAGNPWVAFGEAAGGEVEVAWAGRRFTQAIGPAQPEIGDTVRLLYGARRIADLESRMTTAAENETLTSLAALSEQFGLASRAMALVAVIERAGDAAGALPKTQVVPVGMPQDTRYGSYFAAPRMLHCSIQGDLLSLAGCGGDEDSMPGMPAQAVNSTLGGFRLHDLFKRRRRAQKIDKSFSNAMAPVPSTPAADDETDSLVETAASLAPDGGVDGGDAEDRALKTIAALFLFLSAGNTPTQGAFRAHVERMVRYLETLAPALPNRKKVLDEVVAFARAGKKPKPITVASGPDGRKDLFDAVAALVGIEKMAKADRLSWESVEKAIT